MNTSNVIKGVVSNDKYNVVGTITQWDYGYIFQIEGTELPTTYRVDFATDRHYGEALTVYGDENGVEIPEELIATGKDIYAFYYFLGDGYGKTAHTWRIQNDLRARTSDRKPTPSQQDSIDQAIVKVNEAVELAEVSAQSASDDADLLRNASAEATSLPSRSEATAAYSNGVFSFGIPKGIDAITMDVQTEAILINTNPNGKLTANTVVEIIFKVYDGDTLVMPTAIDATMLEGTPPLVIRSTTNKARYTLPYNKQMQYDNGSITISATYGGKTITHVIPYAVIKSAANAISVYFGLDNVIFHTPSDGILTSQTKITIPIRPYYGTTLTAASSITANVLWVRSGNLMTQVNPAIIDRLEDARVSYTVPAGKSLAPESSNITINVTVMGITYTKTIPYITVKDGVQGEIGPKGDTGDSGVKYVKDDPSDNGGVIEGHTSANSASGAYAHSEGDGTTASAPCSHAEGYQATAGSTCSHAEGRETTANAFYAHAEGGYTTASGEYSHAEGGNTTASGQYSHAEGSSTTASGTTSHAEGISTTASGTTSHAEGGGTLASGGWSHAEGGGTLASGAQSHAEGASTIASGDNSHAENLSTTASGACSHASGVATIAQRKSQMVIGEYNVADTGGNNVTTKGNYIFVAGNGVSNSERSNAMTLDWSGNIVAKGKITAGTHPYNPMDLTTKQYVDELTGGQVVFNMEQTDNHSNPFVADATYQEINDLVNNGIYPVIHYTDKLPNYADPSYNGMYHYIGKLTDNGTTGHYFAKPAIHLDGGGNYMYGTDYIVFFDDGFISAGDGFIRFTTQ